MLRTKAYMRFPNGCAKVLTLSYDDAVEQDRMLLEILDRYGIKASFHINSGCYAPEDHVYPAGHIHRRLTKSQAIALYQNSGHEVAAHTLSHEFLDGLATPAVLNEVLSDRLNLEADFKRIVRGMSLPYGAYNDSVIEIMKACGIAYSRTTEADESFEMPSDWLRITPTCRHSHPKLTELAERFIETPSNAKPKMFYLWGHSYEFEQQNNWQVIEDFCRYMGGRKDIWYASSIEIYEYAEAYDRLVWSADMSTVTNPSSVSIWMRYARKGEHSHVVQVPAGKTIIFE